MKIKNWDIVEIKWLDSLHSSGWKYLNDKKFGLVKDMTHNTIGYVVSSNPRSLAVCQSKRKDLFSDGDNSVDSIMEIPRQAILSIRRLK